MSKRSERARIAEETLVIQNTGTYTSPLGVTVEIGDAMEVARQETRLVSPSDHRSLRQQAQRRLQNRRYATTIEVQNETTFSAAKRLVDRFGSGRVAALNFASAKNPGGGFLNGSQAQEESLARASGLYACLQMQPEYYNRNRAEHSLLYTDHMIVSPCVPVFRDDADTLLEEPWAVTVITAPAPNAGAIAKNQPERLDDVESVFQRRIEQVLVAAVVWDQSALVLGAWGCGVFGNDPDMVAGLFAKALLDDGPFAGAFEHVAFAVLDSQGRTLASFAEALKSTSQAPGTQSPAS